MVPEEDTVAWIQVGLIRTLGVFRHGAWWYDVDCDETGISGNRVDEDVHVDVLTVLIPA